MVLLEPLPVVLFEKLLVRLVLVAPIVLAPLFAELVTAEDAETSPVVRSPAVVF